MDIVATKALIPFQGIRQPVSAMEPNRLNRFRHQHNPHEKVMLPAKPKKNEMDGGYFLYSNGSRPFPTKGMVVDVYA